MSKTVILTAGLKQEQEYWLAKLANLPAPASLIPDHTRPDGLPPVERASVPVRWSPQLSARLIKLTGGSSFLLYAALLAALKVCLYRYSGERVVATGSPRLASVAEVEGEENVVVVVDEIDERMSFRELLLRVKGTLTEAYERQSYPYGRLMKELREENAEESAPLFNVTMTLPEIHGKLPPDFTGEVSISVARAGAEVTAEIEYDARLLERESVERFAGHWEQVLERALERTNISIGEIEMMKEGERRRIVVEWNETRRAYEQVSGLAELFERQVARSPHETALVYEGAELTYEELNRRANQVANYLRRLGVRPEVLVGVGMERSVELVVALLGILKAGGAYVPLDPEYPAERLAFMLADAGAPVLLTQTRLAEKFAAEQARVVCVDAEWGQIGREHSELDAESGVVPENLAYLIYTSGSTGQPKGAMNPQRGICNRLFWMQDEYELTTADRVLQKTPFSFDVSVWEFFWPLINGARLVLARPGGQQDSAYLAQLINDEQITTLHFVPSMLQVFLETPGLDRCRSLRRVICSGEALPPALVERFYERLDAELHNLYGPTEAAVDVTFRACPRDTGQRTVPIGRPIANTQIYLLDENLALVPVGLPGELYIGGVNVGRGYYKQPALTAEKFIPDPFGGDAGARLYRTGDLARYMADGQIEFLSRIDTQVKVRGYRIELGEIEAVLGRHPQVLQAVVATGDDAAGGKRLVAYLVPAQDSTATPDELRRWLMERLPDYMTPSAWVFLAELPLTPSGKVNRRLLPAPGRDEFAAAAEEFVAPRTELEQVLARICGNLLGVEPLGVTDNFFSLGGHSLLATQFVHRLHEALDVRLELRTVFESPTVAALAEHMRQETDRPEELEKLAALLNQLEGLTEEEAAALLEEESLTLEEDRQ